MLYAVLMPKDGLLINLSFFIVGLLYLTIEIGLAPSPNQSFFIPLVKKKKKSPL